MSGDKTSPFIETMFRRSHHVRPPLKLRTHADDPLPTHTQPHTLRSATPVISTLSNHTPHSVLLSFTLLGAVDFPSSLWFQENTVFSPGDISPNVLPYAVDKHLLLLLARSASCCP